MNSFSKSCPKFVNLIQETESSECCARKLRNQRAFDIQKREREKREFKLDHKEENCDKYLRKRLNNIKFLQRRSKDNESMYDSSLESANSVKVNRYSRYSDEEVRKKYLNRFYRKSITEPNGKYIKTCSKLRRFSSEIKRPYFETENKSLDHVYSDNLIKCHGCGNHESKS